MPLGLKLVLLLFPFLHHHKIIKLQICASSRHSEWINENSFKYSWSFVWEMQIIERLLRKAQRGAAFALHFSRKKVCGSYEKEHKREGGINQNYNCPSFWHNGHGPTIVLKNFYDFLGTCIFNFQLSKLGLRLYEEKIIT